MLEAIDSGQAGIAAGFDRLNTAAAKIAGQGVEGDLASNLVDLSRARYEVRANVAIVHTADEMIGILLDVLA
jgi:hypothetical protein